MSREPIAATVVWDPLVRVGHWLLVVAFAVAYVTEGEPELVHTWAGYVIALYVIWRVVWGFAGPRHARFADFVYRPRMVFGYLADLVRFRSRRYLGHSPAGGAMVVALLIVLAATTVTGMATLAVREGEGPLAPFVAAPGPALARADAALEALERALSPIRAAWADDDEGREGAKPGREIKELHEFLANLALILVLAHIAGVGLASLAHGENLPRAMWTGRKRRED
ncbi:MAG: cytochrome b/b6 domain-containing protein [Alphaproteobacteria bacterium]